MNISIVWGVASKILALGATGAMIGATASQIVQTEPVVYHAPVVEESSVAETRVPGAELVGDVVVTDHITGEVSRPSKTPSEGTSEPQAPSVPSAPAEPAQKRFTSFWEFEEAYMGVCPKDVPEGVWGDELDARVALGYRSTVVDDPIENFARSVFAAYHRSDRIANPKYSIGVEDLGVKIHYNNGSCYSDGRWVSQYPMYFLRSNGQIVWVDSSEALVEATPEEMAEMQRIADQLTVRIQQLNAQYASKCGV